MNVWESLKKAVRENGRASYPMSLYPLTQLRETTAPEGEARHLDGEGIGAPIAGSEVLTTTHLSFPSAVAPVPCFTKVDGLSR